MSLNGLDETNVVEAYETATSEPGGWLLLRYSSRDEVELLSRGNGGIAEMRNAVAEYDETSPLYGLLKYRRRNVITKYLPQDCSRLIQARVAVHFNAICERFSPYDTTFEFALASELKESKLSAACSLHAASCSTSSSNSSLRRRRLMEIAEEEEEEQRATKRQSVAAKADRGRSKSPAADTLTVDSVALDSQLAASPEHSEFSAHSTSELPTFVGVDHGPPSPAKPSDADSTQARPDLFSYSSYPYSKPKIKLGPRPSLDVGGRPQTAGNFRPVSAIPAGFKLFGKGGKKGKGGKDQHYAAATQQDISGLNFTAPTLALPPESLRAQADATRPATSSGVPAETLTMPPPPTPKKLTISPEKVRLLKAMQLREKKMMKSQPVGSALSSTDAAAPESKWAQAETSEEIEQESEGQAQPEPDTGHEAVKADAGVVPRTPSVHTDQTSDLTQSDSRPASPVLGASEADQSTKASSLSGSTDETVRAKDEESSPDREDDEAEFLLEGDGAEKTLSAVEDMPAADETNPKEMAVSAPEEKHEEIDFSKGMRNPPAPEADDIEDGRDTSPPVTASEVSPVPEADLASETDSPGGNEPHAAVVLPTSKFSANIPSPTRLPHEASPSNSDSETTKMPAATPADATTTTTDKNEEAASRQQIAPKSEVSTQDLLAAAKAAAVSSTAVPPVPSPAPEASPAAASDEATADAEAREEDGSEAETLSAQAGQRKRKGLIGPILTDLSQHSQETPRSRSNLEDDEDLMEELQSATVQEAKSMLVAKTPVSAAFATSPTTGRTSQGSPAAHMGRTTSNPVRGKLGVSTDVSQTSARSMSSGAAYLHQVTQQQQQQGGNMAKKPNIGSSISQRIKALEKLSAASGDTGTTATRERPSSTFFAVKKREPSRSPSVMDRAKSLRTQTPDLPSGSNESSPEPGKHSQRERSGSVTGRLSMFESPPEANTSGHSPSKTQRGRPESVSVTAKIIRDPNHSMKVALEHPKDASEHNRLDLKQSPLLVDHQRAMPGLTPAALDAAPGRRSGSQERTKSSKSRQSSLSVVKDFIKERRKSVASNQGDVLAASNPSRSPSRPPSLHQNSSFSPRLSMSSRRSSLSKDHENAGLSTGEYLGDDAKSGNGEKKLSRAGRFMRRLSTLSGSRSKTSPTTMSPTVTEEENSEPTADRPATTGSPTIISYLGDVNVQFPDTLLWKRRNMCLDSQGFLILSGLPAQSSRQAQGTKRYHLGEFRLPYAPDVEVQELPNSVVLDFIEGTSIQVACEDRAGQLNLLNVLREAHGTRGATYGL